MAANVVVRQVGDLTLEIDRNACSAFEACVGEAPEVFRLGDDDVITFADSAAQGRRQQILAAVSACPVAALCAKDASGKVIAP
ncbi:MAG: ferredoxin [Deltaproteobacteria bacterium]|nr:ferredoxin [Deltaproteobacteria bacterium]